MPPPWLDTSLARVCDGERARPSSTESAWRERERVGRFTRCVSHRAVDAAEIERSLDLPTMASPIVSCMNHSASHAAAPPEGSVHAAPPSTEGTLTRHLPVGGLSCASCVGRATRAIEAVPGVTGATVNLATGRATVALSDPSAIVGVARALESAGYPVPDAITELRVEGMSCASCVGRIEKALLAVPGVRDASVNLASSRASVRFATGSVSPEALVEAVRDGGYAASVVEAGARAGKHDADAREASLAALRRDLSWAALLTLPVFLLEMGSHVAPGVRELVAGTIGSGGSALVQFVLTTLVLAGPGRRFFAKGVPALLRGAPDMNSLVALGTGAAWSYSTLATFAPDLLPAGAANIYFEAAAVIVTLILLGRWLEARARGRTGEAIARLAGLTPPTARVLADGVATDVPLERVRVGDHVQVRPGERVAVDGQVLEGSSWVDESMLTGEPVPLEKTAGAAVIGGTINGRGAFTFEATRVGADTALAGIIRLVEQAQGAKLPIQALVDRVTGWFVPAVMVAAALTFLVWLVAGPAPALSLALVNAVAVLIIACPCAMGLATPTSIMVGTGRGAEMGVLFRQGEALQTLRDVDVVAFDKTGTLTAGRPTLTDLTLAESFERDTVIAALAAVESRSEHPVARAIVELAERESLAVPEARDFQAHAGLGAEARVDERRVAVGAARFMGQLGIDVSGFEDEVARLGSLGRSPLYAAIDGRLAASLAVADEIKETTKPAIDALHALGVRIVMITGDEERPARVVAERLGIDEVVAGVLPEGKTAAIEALQESARRVAFVGDGINDAPALAQSDVGIAIGTGTDVAIESADVVLMSGDLGGVANAIGLSRRTITNIRQNLFWAFAYNTLLIPVAAGVLYPAFGVLLSPMLAAGAMALSSVFVLGNALRLRYAPVAIIGRGAEATSGARGHDPVAATV